MTEPKLTPDEARRHPRYLAVRDAYDRAWSRYSLADTQHGRETQRRAIERKQDELRAIYIELTGQMF